MRFDDIDEYTVNLADAYAKDAYQKGYEAGKKDAVKHGHWVTQYDLDGNITHYECTNCDFGLLWANDDALPKYCPECGAKMDGDKHE